MDISVKSEHHHVKISTDRMSKHIEAAWKDSVSFIPESVKGAVHFTYLCSEDINITIQANDIFFRLIRRSVYNTYADKGSFPKILKNYNLSHLSSITCDSVCDALQHPDVNVWFSKNRYGTSGKDMACISKDDLPSYELPQYHVLQSQVRDICLIDGKKFTSRFYMLVWNEQVHLYKGGFVVMHGVPYDQNSTDYDVQINHTGYNKKDGLASIKPLDHFDKADQYWPGVEKAAKELIPALEDLLDASSKSDFIFLGIDYLFQENKDIKIIEVNGIPNFNHTQEVDLEVNRPFVTASIQTMLGVQRDDLIRLK